MAEYYCSAGNIVVRDIAVVGGCGCVDDMELLRVVYPVQQQWCASIAPRFPPEQHQGVGIGSPQYESEVGGFDRGQE